MGWLLHRRVFITLVMFAAACGVPETDGAVGGEQSFHPDGWAGASRPPSGLFDPVKAGESLPAGFRSVLGRDSIAPVYVPNFVAGREISWPVDELVIGVDLEGEARAYPVGFLNRREIVVDMHRGIPTFVTW